MGKRVLGKGLNALIPNKTSVVLPKEFTYISINKLKPSKNQPRQEISPKELKELAQSINEKGFIQPIVVRKIDNNNYEIVAGERRFEAAKSLGLKEIPTLVKELNDRDAFVLAIIENLQRKNLNSIEEALAFKRLMDEFDFSLEDIARFVSKDKTTVANTLRLLKLPDSVKQALREGLISQSQARTILAADNPRAQEKLLGQILKEGLSVRELEKKARIASHKKRKTDPFILEVEEKLQKSLGTKVKIFNRRNNRGKIVVEYYTLDDLERVIRRIK